MTRHHRVVWPLLFVTSGFLVGIGAAQGASPPKPHPSLTTFETVKVADGIHAFVAPETVALVSGNSTVIIGDDAVLVVDTGHFPTATRKMIAEIRRLTPKPVRFVVNTHWHPDHHSGNFVYQEEFPGVAIISTEYTREQMEKNAGKYDRPEALSSTVEAVRKQLAGGKKRNGSPLTAADREFLNVAIVEAEEAIPELRLVKMLRPNIGFEQRFTVHLGKRAVEVMFLGRGNTGGDAVVYVPDSKILISGDLLVAPTPYAYGSFFGDWIQTLRKVRSMDVAAIVPGHGPVQQDKHYVELVENLLQSVRDQTQSAVKGGLSLEATFAKLDLQRFRKQFAGDDNLRNQAFDMSFLKPGVERAWREAKEGSLSDEN